MQAILYVQINNKQKTISAISFYLTDEQSCYSHWSIYLISVQIIENISYCIFQKSVQPFASKHLRHPGQVLKVFDFVRSDPEILGPLVVFFDKRKNSSK